MTTTLDPSIAPTTHERSPAAPEAPRHDDGRRDANRARRGGLQAFWRGREHDPAWVRPAPARAPARHRALLYLWGLGASGWANTYYSAAVQAGDEELEGVLLRLVRRVELHHRRQVAGCRSGPWRSRPASSA